MDSMPHALEAGSLSLSDGAPRCFSKHDSMIPLLRVEG